MARLTAQRFAIDTTLVLSRVAKGDADSFESLVALHEPRIRRLAYRLLGWRDADIEDVVQDVFLSALKRLGTFRGDAGVATWLTSVTLNRVRTLRRRRLLKFRWLRRQRDETAAGGFTDAAILDDETNVRVRDAVQQLSPKDREVIVLFHLEQLPIAQISKLLGTSSNAIEVRLHRARQKLKTKLGDLMID